MADLRPLMPGGPPRIFRIKYRSNIVRRVGTIYAKIPIKPVTESLFSLTDAMVGKMMAGEIRWFRIDVATPEEIALHRDSLERWTDAISETAATTKVQF